ncbi:hypothetical protein PR202_gb24129 [Eleusine coracana subsp. coracana]|uniref:MSP domain-containing protein n=1 Tax=Eleusine coracana subsp. coracana TaxID=191504 RepID=A0AAV5FHY5_ELECO|nr:hypothetical protein PR202_gb24129 [Eleusine coracana subsp. coracana]
MFHQEFIDLVHKNWRKRLQTRATYTTLEEECDQVKTCIEIALDCLNPDPEKRPKIGSIVHKLYETEKKIEKLEISLPQEAKNDPGSHANKMLAPKALIHVNPQELCYHYPIELNKNLASSLQLTNMTDDHVAYMFVVSDEGKYSSTRAKGIISPRSTWEVVLNMKEQDDSNLLHEEKVVLQSTIVSKDLKPNDITLDMF